MPRSFSSSSFSTSTSSSFSSGPVSGHSIARTSSTYRLKRWLSSHLLRRRSPDLDFTHHYHYHNSDNSNNDNNYTISKWSNSDIISHSPQSSTIWFSPEQEGLGQPRFRHFNYDHEYHNYQSLDGQAQAQRLAGSNQQQEQDGDDKKEEERKEDIALSDNYAAFCRAFTSSPVHCHSIPRQTLPRLPPSRPCEEYEDHAGPDRNPAFAEDVSQIFFLPVGAHGYHSASWTLPRAPSPPPGILTPGRYEIQQQQKREELMEYKQKRSKGPFMWCMPARTPWLPWARAKKS